MTKPAELDLDGAARIALAALTFLAEDAVRLARFLALTGVGPEQLRARAGQPETLVAVLEYLQGDESLLLVFAASKNVRPEELEPARMLLANLGDGPSPS